MSRSIASRGLSTPHSRAMRANAVLKMTEKSSSAARIGVSLAHEVPGNFLALSDRLCYMYDMADHRISVRVPHHLGQRLGQRSKLQGVPESELVREALESYLSPPQKMRSAYDAAVALGVIGCAKGLPRDLSTNPKYMKGFGEDRGE